MTHESQARLVILLSTGCYERKTNNNKALLGKNYLELVHLQLPLFFPLHILPQFKMSLKDFPCLSLPPPSGLAILSPDEELHLQLCGHAGYRDCLAAGCLCSSHLGQQSFPSKDLADKGCAVLREFHLHSTNLFCQE